MIHTTYPVAEVDPRFRNWLLRRVSRAFGVKPRDIGIGVEHPARTAMHTAYRARTCRRRSR